MKSSYLFPARFKKVGWAIFIPTFILGFFEIVFEWNLEFLTVQVPAIFINEFMGKSQFIGFIENNIFDEILGAAMIIGSLLVAFSKERDEDEFISKLRLDSLVWAIYWNYGILLFAMLFVYDISFYFVMLFNMFTVLVFFIGRFNYQLWKLRKTASREE